MDYWALFGISLLTALTGALSPGPLFTFTIEKSLACGRRGWSVGFLAILGHAAIEGVILAIILLGLVSFLSSPLILLIIGIIGGCVLFIFGFLYLRDAKSGKVTLSLQNINAVCEEKSDTQSRTKKNPQASTNIGSYPLWKLPFGGIIVSMSNPYWWFWWATAGIGLITLYLPDLGSGLGISSFFIGHEMGDLLWYVLVSFLIFKGRTKINAKVYRIILLACGIFMIAFGLYFMISRAMIYVGV